MMYFAALTHFGIVEYIIHCPNTKLNLHTRKKDPVMTGADATVSYMSGFSAR